MKNEYHTGSKLDLMNSDEDSFSIYYELFSKDSNFCEDHISKIKIKIPGVESAVVSIKTHTELNLKYLKDSFDLYSTNGTHLGKFEYEFNRNNGRFTLRRLSDDTGKLFIYLDISVETEDEDNSEHKKIEVQSDTNFTELCHVKEFVIDRKELQKGINFDTKVKVCKIEISKIVYKDLYEDNAAETYPDIEFDTEEQKYSSTHMYKLYFDNYKPHLLHNYKSGFREYYDINGHIYINSKLPQ